MRATILLVAMVLTPLISSATDPALVVGTDLSSWMTASYVFLTSGDMPSDAFGYPLSSSEGLVPKSITLASITSVSVDSAPIVVGPNPMRNSGIVLRPLRSQARGHPF